MDHALTGRVDSDTETLNIQVARVPILNVCI